MLVPGYTPLPPPYVTARQTARVAGHRRPRRKANRPHRRPVPPLPAFQALDARAPSRIARVAGRCRPCPRRKEIRPRCNKILPRHRLLSTSPHGKKRARPKENHPRRQENRPRRRLLPPLPALPAQDARAGRRIARAARQINRATRRTARAAVRRLPRRKATCSCPRPCRSCRRRA